MNLNDTLTWGEAFIRKEREAGRHWRRWRGDYLLWAGGWRVLGAEDAEAHMAGFLRTCRSVSRSEDGETVRRAVKVNAKNVNELLRAVRVMAALDSGIEPPAWIGPSASDSSLPRPAEVIPFRGGLLDTRSRAVLQPTPDFFSLSTLPFAVDLAAPEPVAWLAFLHNVWGVDEGSIQTLQEWFGYCLTPDTSQQKMLMLLGPKRSGKGTMMRTLTRLVGVENVVAPAMRDIGENFGLESWIGKSLATVGDARVDRRVGGALVERLLSISGEDAQTVARKFAKAWTGRLGARIVIVSNETPDLVDAAGALADRCILVGTTRSYLGQEDTELEAKLTDELPGILLWALGGLDRLRVRGKFVEPKTSASRRYELRTVTSPVSTFLEERCEVGPDLSVSASELYAAWQDWCEINGMTRREDAAGFGRALRAAAPRVEVRRSESNGARRYYGVCPTNT